MDSVKGVETEAIEKALRAFTEDSEILVFFYEALDQPEMVLQEQKKILKALIEAGRFSEAIEYGQQKSILASEREHEIARTWCESLMEKAPWTALGLARRYKFSDLREKAARTYSELILAGKVAAPVEPVLEIARAERAGDQDYRRRAARYAFGKYIQNKSFPFLPRLVEEFKRHFSNDEIALAILLASYESECDGRELKQIRMMAG